MMNQPIAAPELLNDLTCDCEICEDFTCSYFNNKQPCTAACKCTANMHTQYMLCANVHTLTLVFDPDSLPDSDISERKLDVCSNSSK
ncbi:hypothetical protein DPMN_156716 [Dreissena polymorpha]|uniref:Uncharacterized protein n=1 Tax=Dreissena polymorpha TaxID=45954 RepID=A0A9D4FQ95_DREPO|nr:hypothetical protein DPMN_156716 [Dreissena polymorpha]